MNIYFFQFLRGSLAAAGSTAIFLATVLFLASCSLYTSADSITLATLRRVQKIERDCEARNSDPPAPVYSCVVEYAEKKNITTTAVLMDGFGQSVVVDATAACKQALALPYSKGKNGIDECGRGDDVILQ